jgi:hypothetical protein
MYMVAKKDDAVEAESEKSEVVTAERIIEEQREYMGLLNELFEGAYKCKVSSLVDHDHFMRYSKEKAEPICRELERRLPEAVSKMTKIYGKLMPLCASYAKGAASSVQLVAGGGSRLLETQISSIRKVLLYSDCVYIPDPILPWIETERSEERFRHVQMLRSVYSVLRFKPLVDAKTQRPSVIFFPSFEKVLEAQDEVTQDASGRMFMDVMGHYLECGFEDESEVFAYARDHGDKFLEQVARHALYVAPGGSPNDDLLTAIASHRRERATYMSAEAAQKYNAIPDAAFVAIGIMERLQPQYHLIENAGMLKAQPLLTNAAASHYYGRCATAYNGNLLNHNLLSKETVSTIDALADARFDWMANVPIPTLAELRESGENEKFRERLASQTAHLGEASFEDLDIVARSVASGIQGLVEQHAREMDEMKARWSKRYKTQAIESWVGLGAAFIPMLGPYFSAILGGDALKQYVFAKNEQREEFKAASKSLAGVMAETFSKAK